MIGKEWKENLFIAAVSVFFFLICLEIFLSVTNYSFWPIFLTQDEAGTLRLNSFFEPAEKFAFFSFDAQYGWKNRNNTHGRFISPEFNTEVWQNSQSMRKKDDLPPEQGRKYLTVLGDSFAWGWGVEENQTVASMLESDLGVKVANFGTPGYGTSQELLQYQNEGRGYPAPVVLLLFYEGNDFQDNLGNKSLPCFSKPMHYVENGTLHTANYPVVQCKEDAETGANRLQSSALTELLLKTHVGKAAIEIAKMARDKTTPGREMRTEYGIYLLNKTEKTAAEEEVAHYVLSELKNDTAKNNSTLVVAVVPAKEIVEGSFQKLFEKNGWAYDERGGYRTIKEYGDELGFEVIDLYPALSDANAEGKKLYYGYGDFHWTPQANEIAESALIPKLEKYYKKGPSGG